MEFQLGYFSEVTDSITSIGYTPILVGDGGSQEFKAKNVCDFDYSKYGRGIKFTNAENIDGTTNQMYNITLTGSPNITAASLKNIKNTIATVSGRKPIVYITSAQAALLTDADMADFAVKGWTVNVS